MKIAIVGVGPKGLFCLEQLMHNLARSPTPSRWEVHIFEPHPEPGAGPIYETGQPNYLRMNFATANIDMWSRAGDAATGPDLKTWLERNKPDMADPHGYAPRALVGEYLKAGYDTVVAKLGDMCDLAIHQHRVTDIEHLDGEWLISTDVASLLVDEVIIATGHVANSPAVSDHPQTISSVYPVDTSRGIGSIRPGMSVGIRGFGLTALDACLALTEGRGGRFTHARYPGDFRYIPGPHAAICVRPFSRTGRPMTPKPDLRSFEPPCGMASLLHERRRVISELSEQGVDLAGRISHELTTGAAMALDLIGSAEASGAQVARHFDWIMSGDSLTPGQVVEKMRFDVKWAHGQAEPGVSWALGAAWRGIYPALVELVGDRRMDEGWLEFSQLTREMERVAFGPPAENAARLLALVEHGSVDLSVIDGPDITPRSDGFDLSTSSNELSVDVLIDAVLPPSGVVPGASPLLDRLLDRGQISLVNGGLAITEQGHCIDGAGQITPGLSAVGRPTEGCTLGNDTLSRTLHQVPRRWAEALVTRTALQEAGL